MFYPFKGPFQSIDFSLVVFGQMCVTIKRWLHNAEILTLHFVYMFYNALAY